MIFHLFISKRSIINNSLSPGTAEQPAYDGINLSTQTIQHAQLKAC